MSQAHVFYSGMVQGVGFRYTATHNARALGLTGWVRNLPDGRVEAVINGSKEKIEQLLDKIENHFRETITNRRVEFSDEGEEFSSFQIVQ